MVQELEVQGQNEGRCDIWFVIQRQLHSHNTHVTEGATKLSGASVRKIIIQG